MSHDPVRDFQTAFFRKPMLFGEDLFAAGPELIRQDMEKRATAQNIRRITGQTLDFLDVLPPGERMRLGTYMKIYKLDLADKGETMPPDGQPIWDLTQNAINGKITKSPFVCTLTTNAMPYSFKKGRCLTPREHFLIQGLPTPRPYDLKLTGRFGIAGRKWTCHHERCGTGAPNWIKLNHGRRGRSEGGVRLRRVACGCGFTGRRAGEAPGEDGQGWVVEAIIQVKYAFEGQLQDWASLLSLLLSLGQR